MIKKITIIAFSVSCLLLFSCKKDGSERSNYMEEKPAFFIVLDKNYLSGNRIDSSFAIWEVDGQRQAFKFQLVNDTLKTEIKNFRAGSGKLKLHLFTSIKFQHQYSSQWFQEKQITIQPDRRISINGPTGFHDNQWKPRVLLKDNSGHEALVALRPDDSYFLVKNVPINVLKMTVGRNYWNTIAGVQRVGGGEWQCVSGCTDTNRNIENEVFFNFLPAQIGVKQWNHIEIAIIYEKDRWGGGPVLAMAHRF